MKHRSTLLSALVAVAATASFSVHAQAADHKGTAFDENGQYTAHELGAGGAHAKSRGQVKDALVEARKSGLKRETSHESAAHGKTQKAEAQTGAKAGGAVTRAQVKDDMVRARAGGEMDRAFHESRAHAQPSTPRAASGNP